MGMSPIAELITEVQQAFVDQHGVELSQAAIARAAGLSTQRMSQIMNGEIKRVPEQSTIDGLAKALKVSKALVLQRFMESAGLDIPDEFPVAARKGVPRRIREAGEDPS